MVSEEDVRTCGVVVVTVALLYIPVQVQSAILPLPTAVVPVAGALVSGLRRVLARPRPPQDTGRRHQVRPLDRLLLHGRAGNGTLMKAPITVLYYTSPLSCEHRQVLTLAKKESLMNYVRSETRIWNLLHAKKQRELTKVLYSTNYFLAILQYINIDISA